MRLSLLMLVLLTGTPLLACCPTDKDTLADEMGSLAVLDAIAGRVERHPPEYHRARLETLDDAEDVESTLKRARLLDQLNRQPEALSLIEMLSGRELTPGQRMRLNAAKLQLGMHLWWRGGADKYTPGHCVEIARQGLNAQPPNQAMSLILDWMADDTPADPTRMWRDMLSLRLAPNKTSATATGQLAQRGLEGADKLLLDLIRAHPCWENFDTFYALSLVYAVEGKQNLAHYVQQRMWKILREGGTSRVPIEAPIEDIRVHCVVRQRRAGALVAVTLVTEENKHDITRQFAARGAYAEQLKQARADYVTTRIADGHAPDANDFWSAFKAPRAVIPPPGRHAAATGETDGPSPEEETVPGKDAQDGKDGDKNGDKEDRKADEDQGRGATWISLGVLLVILMLGGVSKMRIDRSARRAVQASEARDKDRANSEKSDAS